MEQEEFRRHPRHRVKPAEKRFFPLKKLATWIIVLAMLLSAATADTVIHIPPIEQQALTVDPIPQSTAALPQAGILRFNGEIAHDGQTDSWQFDQPCRGRCRVEIGGMTAGTKVTLEVYDAQGSKLDSYTYCTNGQGLTLKDLPAGLYEARVIQQQGTSPYVLTVGLQKETVDLSGLTLLTDSVEYTDQRNVYSFTVPRDGRYRFEFARMMSGMKVDLYVFNDLNETVGSYTYCTNGCGLTLKDLKAGEVYEVQVRQNSDVGSYNLIIGLQKETVDLSGLTLLTDSVEYTDQRNVYSFTVPRDGRYRFEFARMMSGMKVDLYVFNDLNETVGSYTYCTNGCGLTLKDLKAGEVYEVQVRQSSDVGSYNLLIGLQKETVAVQRGSRIEDSVEFTDQRNVYSFTPDIAGSCTLTLSGVQSGTNFDLYVFDDLGSVVNSRTYAANDSTLKLDGLLAGVRYEIQVRQSSGTGSYALSVE